MLLNQSAVTITLFAATSLILLTGLLLFGQRTHKLELFYPPLLASYRHPTPQKPRTSITVAIIETIGAHDEVVAAFAHSFGSQPSTNTSLYLARSRFGMSDIIANFTLPHPLDPQRHIEEFGGSTIPDIVIATTCEWDTTGGIHERFDELAKLGRTHLFCVMHHADRYNEKRWEDLFKPWLKNNLFSFVALSPHTATFLNERGLSNWSAEYRKKVIESTKTLPPVFPVSLPPLSGTANGSKIDELAFALQGNYEASRRDFNTVFQDMEKLTSPSSSSSSPPNSGQKQNITLHLLGSGNRPAVPPSVQNVIIFDQDLSYIEYYRKLSQSLAVLPAFADDGYLQTKASSTVPAALMGGTPVIATKRLREAYAYLGNGSAYLQGDEETELEVMQNIVKMTEEGRGAVKAKVKEQLQVLLQENIRMAGDWIDEIIRMLDNR